MPKEVQRRAALGVAPWGSFSIVKLLPRPAAVVHKSRAEGVAAVLELLFELA